MADTLNTSTNSDIQPEILPTTPLQQMQKSHVTQSSPKMQLFEANIRKSLTTLADEKVSEESVDEIGLVTIEITDRDFRIQDIGSRKIRIYTPSNDAILQHFDQIQTALEKCVKFTTLSAESQERILKRIQRSRAGNRMIEKGAIDQHVAEIMQRVAEIHEKSHGQDEIAYQNLRNASIENLAAEESDLVHGTTVEQLGAILENGLMCNETAQGELDNFGKFGLGLKTAETTFFADFWEVKTQQNGDRDYVTGFDSNWIAEPESENISLIFKKQGRISITEEQIARPGDYREKGYGTLLHQFPEPSMPHAGVFIGAASTDISAIIAGGKTDVEKLQQILIAKKRFIPIFSTSHVLLFGYEEFKRRLAED